MDQIINGLVRVRLVSTFLSEKKPLVHFSLVTNQSEARI